MLVIRKIPNSSSAWSLERMTDSAKTGLTMTEDIANVLELV